jgi:AraC-like DNA-binding protein
MGNVDIASVTTEVRAVYHHHWDAGQKFRHDPARHGSTAFEYHIWFVQQGNLEVRVNNQSWQLKSDDVCVLPLELARDILAIESTVWFSARLRITIFQQFDLLNGLHWPVQWQPDEGERRTLEDWMLRLLQTSKNEVGYEQLLVAGLGNALLGLCWPHLTSLSLEQSAHRVLPEWLSQTLHRIGAEPSISINTLAQSAGFSPAQFRRLFRKWLGTAPQEYLKMRRLEVARHMLETSDLPPSQIAIHIGLHDASHFSQLFKKVYGLSPSQYRVSVNDGQG